MNLKVKSKCGRVTFLLDKKKNLIFETILLLKARCSGGAKNFKKCRLPWLGDEENFLILIVSKRSKKPIKCISLSVKLIQIMF